MLARQRRAHLFIFLGLLKYYLTMITTKLGRVQPYNFFYQTLPNLKGAGVLPPGRSIFFVRILNIHLVLHFSFFGNWEFKTAFTLGARGSIFLSRRASGWNGEAKKYEPLVTAVRNLTSMQFRNKISCQTSFQKWCQCCTQFKSFGIERFGFDISHRAASNQKRHETTN